MKRPSSTVPLPLALALVTFGAGCGPEGDRADAAPASERASVGLPAQAAFWQNLQALCPLASDGELLQAPEGDTQIPPDARLVVHFRECGEEELRFPLHVDDDRSRTWTFIRHADGIELRHDHRNADGSEASNTWYGARTLLEGEPTRQEFVSERDDGSLGGWRVEIVPGERFTYGTIRDGAWRHHLAFDLTRPVDAPPPPWGHDVRPSQHP